MIRNKTKPLTLMKCSSSSENSLSSCDIASKLLSSETTCSKHCRLCSSKQLCFDIAIRLLRTLSVGICSCDWEYGFFVSFIKQLRIFIFLFEIKRKISKRLKKKKIWKNIGKYSHWRYKCSVKWALQFRRMHLVCWWNFHCVRAEKKWRNRLVGNQISNCSQYCP